MKNYAFKPGDPWVMCQRCGLDYRWSATQLEWTGLRVCHQCWEPRHPQEFVRGIPDRRAVEGAVPEPPDVFIPIIWSRDEVAEDWQGTYPSGVYPTLFGDGWFAGWFVVPWFEDGGFYLEAINVNGLIYTTEGFFGLNGMLTANFSYAIDTPANATVTLQYQTCDDGRTWEAWTPYTGPFDPGFLTVRFGIFVAMTGPYHLWVDTLNYSVSV